jgi:hypothetical protein
VKQGRPRKLSGSSRASEHENAGSNDRADAQRGQRPRAQSLL